MEKNDGLVWKNDNSEINYHITDPFGINNCSK